jgi:Tfp pilus assembly protein PilN
MSVMSPTRRADAVPVVTWPQVNLLPAEVTQGRRLKSIKRLLLLALLVVLLLATLAYTGAVYVAGQAADDLAAAQADTARLQEEKAAFAEVPAILSSISQAESARQQGMSSEILWGTYLESLRGTAPAGVSFDTLTVNVGTPSQPYVGSTDPLATPGSIGQISFTARSTTLPDTGAWIDGINTIKGLDNPSFSAASLTEDEGVVFYQVEATVDLLPSALSGRFEPEAQQ